MMNLPTTNAVAEERPEGSWHWLFATDFSGRECL